MKLTHVMTVLCVLLASMATTAAMADRPPNVVIILTDDQGHGDLSLHGNKDLDTPHIDTMARHGAQLKRFYVSPVCSPTRAELLTGRYHPRAGVYSTSAGGERIDLDETTIADVFKAADYATGCFGKWHNGSQYPYHPNGRGFDEYYGMPSGHWAHYFDWWVDHNGRHVDFEGYIADAITDRAIDFMQANRDKPFLCYLAFNTPHAPMQVPDRFYEKFDDKQLQSHHRDPDKEDPQHMRAALAMCENIDFNVGRMLEALDGLDLSRDTIVVYFSDNGPNGWRFNNDLRGKKGSTDEGGVRSPCFIRWPGQIEAGTIIDAPAAAIDLLPTLTALSGVPINIDKPLDGVNLAPLLRGQTTQTHDRLIITRWGGRSNQHRISARGPRYMFNHVGNLYDLVEDPGQRHNIAKQHPEITRRFKQAVEQYKKDVLSEIDDAPRPFPVGYPEFPVTYLPARDGAPHGKIERSNKFPNASFFENWKRMEDTITWDIEINKPGRYEAIVHYTIRSQDAGAVMKLSLGDAALSATVDKVFDPPLIGKAHDRHPRPESYAKRFAPLKMGRFKLPAGRATLTLSAVKIPGDEAIDVGGVTLRLLDD